MQIGIEPVIYVAIFASVLLLVEGLYLAVFGRSINFNRRVNRRLALLEAGKGREQVLEQLRKEMTQHVTNRDIPLYALLAAKARKANIAFSPVQLVALIAILSGAAFAALTFATGATLALRVPLAVGMGAGGVYVWVSSKASKRMALIEEQLPDAVGLMVRALRVGHPFSAALATVARETPDPLGSEMGLIADEAAYGRDVGEALKAMAERLQMQDLRFLAVAVTIQGQSGGNLAEVLDGLATVIRSRFRLFRRVKAITAEARFSGLFLSAFPIVALVAILLGKPDYFDEVKTTAYFVPGCFAFGGFLVANILVMRALVNIKV